MNNVLVVAAHADDEALGSGIAIQRHIEAGDKVSIAVMCRRSYGHKRPEIAMDRAECEALAKELGCHRVFWGDFTDESLDGDFVAALAFLEEAWAECDPSVAYTPNAGDVNQDHLATARACRIVLRPYALGRCAKTVLVYEVPGSTDAASGFFPNWYVLAERRHVEKKCELMGRYKSEIRDYPHPRSPAALLGLASARGREVGRDYAEAFMLTRHVVQ